MFHTLLTLCVLASAKSATIVDLAVATPDLSTLVTALKAGKLVDTLSGPGPFTVFAPTNEAFAALPKALLDHLLDPKNIKELDEVLTYHVASGSVHAKDLKNHEQIKTVEGKDVEAFLYHDKVFINDAEVTKADIDASNGVVHIINHVLIPRGIMKRANLLAAVNGTASTIVDLAVATPDLSTLVTALKAGKLVDTLSGPGPFTVFAPTNEAFAALPKALLDHLLDPKNIKELDEVLTYHVASGSVHAKDLKNHEQIKTVEGKDVEAFLYHDKVFINDAEVTKADIDASNGVVHIINHVLIPRGIMKRANLLAAVNGTASTIVDLAVATPDLSTLVTALKAGKLVDTLSGPGPFTVFAPTNEAFAALPKALLDHLLDPKNIKELDEVLTYHVASGSVHAKDLKNHEQIKTVEGKDVEAFLYHDKVFINDAEVTKADIDASNGVVHIINHVLIPRGIMKRANLLAAVNGTASTIVDLAVATPDLSTLVTALKAGKLVDTLSGPGPFTVFAPTNEAFAALPKALLDHLLDPKNIKELDEVLTYHVASGSVHAKDLKNHEQIKTVEGKDVEAFLYHDKVFINDAEVTKADIDASNGVVHIINHVLIPRQTPKAVSHHLRH